MNYISQRILFFISSLALIFGDTGYDTTHISIYTVKAKRTISSFYENIIYKQFQQSIIYVEVPNGQIEQIKEEFSKFTRIRISESIYTYEQISLIEKSQFIINLNLADYDEGNEETDNNDILYLGNQYLSSYINFYYLSKSGYSLKGLNYFRKHLQIDKQLDENLILQISKETITLKQFAQGMLKKKSFLTEKIQQHRWGIQNYLYQTISQAQLEETLTKYMKFMNQFWIITKDLFTLDEIEEMISKIILLKLKYVGDEQQLNLIMIQQLMDRPTIYFHNQQKLRFKNLNQQFLSVYTKDIEKTYQQIYFNFLNPSFESIEVPKEQYQFIVERISGYYNTSMEFTKQRIMASQFTYQQLNLLIHFKYIKKSMILKNNTIIFSNKNVLSFYIYSDVLVKNGYKMNDAIKHAFISITSRAGSRHFYKLAEIAFGRRNLLSILNKLIDWFVKFLPKSVYETVASRIFSHKVSGAAAQTSFRKFFRTEFVSGMVVNGFFFLWDLNKLIKGRLTGSEFVKGQIANAASFLCGSLGGTYGMAFGPIGSFVGAVAGGVGCYIAGDKLTNMLAKTNAEILAQFAEDYIEMLADVLTEKEIDSTIETFRTQFLQPLTAQLLDTKPQHENWQQKVKQKIISILYPIFSLRNPNQLKIEQY